MGLLGQLKGLLNRQQPLLRSHGAVTLRGRSLSALRSGWRDRTQTDFTVWDLGVPRAWLPPERLNNSRGRRKYRETVGKREREEMDPPTSNTAVWAHALRVYPPLSGWEVAFLSEGDVGSPGSGIRWEGEQSDGETVGAELVALGLTWSSGWAWGEKEKRSYMGENRESAEGNNPCSDWRGARGLGRRVSFGGPSRRER